VNYATTLATPEVGAPPIGSPALERIVEVFVALDRYRVESVLAGLDDRRMRRREAALDRRRWRNGS
jgi:hypothetical protein